MKRNIVRSLKDSEKGFIVSGQRLRTLGCCIKNFPLTLPFPWRNIWPKRIFQWLRSPRTRLIWVRVTSSSSRNSNSISKVVILELWTTCKRSCHTNWGHFHMKNSSAATGSGSNFSGVMRLPKGTALKGIMLNCGSLVNKIIIAPFSLLFRHTSYIPSYTVSFAWKS